MWFSNWVKPEIWEFLLQPEIRMKVPVILWGNGESSYTYVYMCVYVIMIKEKKRFFFRACVAFWVSEWEKEKEFLKLNLCNKVVLMRKAPSREKRRHHHIYVWDMYVWCMIKNMKEKAKRFFFSLCVAFW